MGPTEGYMTGVVEHWGNYSDALAPWAGPGPVCTLEKTPPTALAVHVP